MLLDVQGLQILQETVPFSLPPIEATEDIVFLGDVLEELPVQNQKWLLVCANSVGQVLKVSLQHIDRFFEIFRTQLQVAVEADQIVSGVEKLFGEKHLVRQEQLTEQIFVRQDKQLIAGLHGSQQHALLFVADEFVLPLQGMIVNNLLVVDLNHGDPILLVFQGEHDILVVLETEIFLHLVLLFVHSQNFSKIFQNSLLLLLLLQDLALQEFVLLLQFCQIQLSSLVLAHSQVLLIIFANLRQRL